MNRFSKRDENFGNFQVSIMMQLPVYRTGTTFSVSVTRCTFAQRSESFVKTPHLQSHIKFEALATATDAKVLQAADPVPVKKPISIRANYGLE